MGLVGVAIFAFSFPFTKLLVPSTGPYFIAFGRAAVAGLASGLFLLIRGGPVPDLKTLGFLGLSAGGIVFMFPLLSAMSLEIVDSSHAGVILALMPLMTALFGVLIDGDRPSGKFWFWAAVGMLLTVYFAYSRSPGELNMGDLLLFAGMIFCSMGYAVGGKMTHSVGGTVAICWSLVLSLPVTIPSAIWFFRAEFLELSTPLWFSFFYLALFSQLIGFFFWYSGLSRGGIARVSQIQLLQPFFTIFVSYFILSEKIEIFSLVIAAGVVISVSLGKSTVIRKKNIDSKIHR